MQDCVRVKTTLATFQPNSHSLPFPLLRKSGGLPQATEKAGKVALALVAFLFTLLAATLAAASSQEAFFRYVGGTENLEQDCQGKLEVTSSALVFTCPSRPVEMPFTSITLMEFRPDLSRRVRRMKKLKWKMWPDLLGPKTNRYFTIVYHEEGLPHVVVLKVEPQLMRPYLAEIELKSGKRVQVKGYEDYQ